MMNLPLRLRKIMYRDYLGSRFKIHQRLDSSWLLNYGNYVDRKLILGRPFEDEQLKYFSTEINRRGCTVFVDVGANFGLYTVYLAGHCSTLEKVYAIEPQKRNFNQLCANLLLNDLSSKVFPLAWGASDSRRTVEFLENKGSSTGTSRIAETAPSSTRHEKFETVTLEVDALDNLLPDLSQSVVAMKIDVEGHELAVFQGAQNLLKEVPCLIQVEVLDDDLHRLEHLTSTYGLTEVHRIDCDLYFCNSKMLSR